MHIESISIIYLLSGFIAWDLTSSAPFLVLIECLFSRMSGCLCVNACMCVCVSVIVCVRTCMDL